MDIGVSDTQGRPDIAALVWGIIWGLLAGALIGLFIAPRAGSETRREISRSSQALVNRIEAATPPDPVADSMAAGKAAAHRRRVDLGLERKS